MSIPILQGHVGWRRAATVLDPWQRIKALAVSDGWAALYNPGDPTTITLSGSNVTAIASGVGSYPALTAVSTGPTLGIIGKLPALNFTGTQAMKSAAYASDITPDMTIITVLKVSSLPTATNTVIDNFSTASSASLNLDATGVARINFGSNLSLPSNPVTSGTPLVFSATATATEQSLYINGITKSGALSAAPSLTGLTYGSSRNNTSYLTGLGGPALIYNGVISEAALTRMQTLLTELSAP